MKEIDAIKSMIEATCAQPYIDAANKALKNLSHLIERGQEKKARMEKNQESKESTKKAKK